MTQNYSYHMTNMAMFKGAVTYKIHWGVTIFISSPELKAHKVSL